jgi:hypothetical protein
MTTELEVLEYLLGLGGLGLGTKAYGIYTRHMAREIRPLLLKQQALLKVAVQTETSTDPAVKALDADLGAAWGRCLDALKTLWLTEGPDAVEAA